MNIGKTAALVTAAAGAVVFGGTGAGAFPGDNPSQQVNDCDTASGVGVSAPGAGANCLNFSEIFGDPHGVVQQNHCDSKVGSAANVTVLAPTGGGETGSHCANVALTSPSQSLAGHPRMGGQGGYGAGHR
ncbi:MULTISPECIES: hypothetical protein [unclassified Streptomyces]|uniref:hypothetical protein n=1 Tax=unclassified Streptomyces TaxID=2593676 RepID=UPI00336A4822